VENNTASAEQREYLTVAEVSSLFRVGVPTIYRRVADGQLPHIRIGDDGPIRIPAGELGRLFGQREETSQSGREPSPVAASEKTAARGYGAKHQAKRRRWAKRIYSGEEVNCARCGYPILPGQAWDLGNVDGDKSRYQGPEHRRCNRATATHEAKRSRRTSYAYVDEQPCKVSRQW
jgi:excisionase family DNA binding protein